MNRHRTNLSICVPLFIVAASCAPLRAADAVVFRDGERIVLIGDTFIERDQRYGYFETNLLARFPKQRLQFRNLGWSGDTPDGLSRSYFDPPAVGKMRLHEQLAAVRPTTLIVGYGMAASFAGEPGLPPFQASLRSLLDTGRALGADQFVLLAPIPHEASAGTWPAVDEHNRKLAAYARAIGETARAKQAWFVDLRAQLRQPNKPDHERPTSITDNGIHPHADGYWWIALELEAALGFAAQPITTELRFDGTIVRQAGASVRVLETQPNRLSFEQLDARLPTPNPPAHRARVVHPHRVVLTLKVRDLPEGRYTLSIDGRTVHSADAAAWSEGVLLDQTPQHDQVEQLRRLVCRKNRLYFERYRPQNITYLLGFRKYEQGQNARELEQLEQKVAEAETQIDELKVPKPHRFVLTRER
jgi:hypothetical protein